MVDPRGEVDLRRLERVVSREMNVEEEHSARIWRIVWTHDGSLPVILILLINWTG